MIQINRLSLLVDSIRDDLSALGNIREKITELNLAIQNDSNYSNRMALALTIHNFYNCIENIFTAIAGEFSNELTSETWHMDLLKRMKLDRENIRPAVIDQQLFTFLNNIRGFRHVVRHSYDYDMDYRRMLLIVEDIETHYDHFLGKINAFIAFIHEQIKKIEDDA